MKILYAIQGTGNGHLMRAAEIVPILRKYAETDILLSGSHSELKLPFDIKYRMHGLGFIFGKKGGVDILATFLNLNLSQLIREIKNLPVHNYDLIISDFEPVSCWAAYLRKKICFGLSNQAVTLHPLAPQPGIKDPLGRMILERYAPVTKKYGYHFRQFDETVFSPIIRSEVRNAVISNEGHITVYLPSYKNERIIKALSEFKNFRFEVFSKHSSETFRKKNLYFRPLNQQEFLKSLSTSDGVLTNAGFGTCSEALFLGKKLLVIPMKNQYEQHCNAAVLKSMGIATVKSLRKKHVDKIRHWLHQGHILKLEFPENTELLIQKMLEDYRSEVQKPLNSIKMNTDHTVDQSEGHPSNLMSGEYFV